MEISDAADGGEVMMARGCSISGWGVALPDQIVSNAQIASILDTDEDWIVERSGIRFRHVATGPLVLGSGQARESGSHGTTSELAVRAGKNALDRAGLQPNEIGMLILCTTTPDQLIPATSSAVAAGLGIRSGAMDLNAACAGFTYGLVVAAGLIATGVDRVLLIGSETLTRATNWKDRTTAFLFGDGAAAVVLEATPDHVSLLGWDLGVDGDLGDLLFADHGSGMIMKGKQVFRSAVKATVESARASMGSADVKPMDIDLFVPHQANSRIMDSVASHLGIELERVASVIEFTGNTSSASIPLALASAIEQGRLNPGDLVLFAGFGAGMTWGSAVWRWNGNWHQSPARDRTLRP